jgi:hypothetical protein
MNFIPSEISPIYVDNTFLHKDVSTSANLQIDAFFIPTLCKRNNILSIIKTINEHRNANIFILSSGNNEMIKNIPSNVSIIDFDKNAHKQYITSFKSTINPTYFINPNFDLPTKRNFALNFSRLNGFKNIALIDDDIILTQQHINKAVYLLENGASMAGFYSMDFPDMSVIDLIECDLLQIPPSVFLSGNCLFINIQQNKGFFPYVYNEDWLFIMSNMNNPIMGAGTIKQCYHEPWNNFQRIKFEQFGDIIGCGIEKSKTHLNTVLPIEKTYWKLVYLEYLERLINLHKVAQVKKKYVQQIETALETTKSFSSDDIVSFMNNFNNEINNFEYEKFNYQKSI